MILYSVYLAPSTGQQVKRSLLLKSSFYLKLFCKNAPIYKDWLVMLYSHTA